MRIEHQAESPLGGGRLSASVVPLIGGSRVGLMRGARLLGTSYAMSPPVRILVVAHRLACTVASMRQVCSRRRCYLPATGGGVQGLVHGRIPERPNCQTV